jgi:hypothetical protein
LADLAYADVMTRPSPKTRTRHVPALVLVVLVHIGVTSGNSFADQCEAAVVARVQEDVPAMLRAVDEGDVDTTLRFTHPKVVQLLGGRDGARLTLQRVAATLKESDTRRESLSFPSPPTCLSARGRRFVIVPTLTVLSIKGVRFESLNYQFGVAEPGESVWTYIPAAACPTANSRTRSGEASP